MIVPGSLPSGMGFRDTKLGGHGARSIMSEELTRLLESTAPDDDLDAYRRAVIDDNCLSKTTLSNKRHSFDDLREFYALDARLPLFRALRRLWKSENANRPLLAFQAAYARESLLRASASLVLSKRPGAPLVREETEELLRVHTHDAYSVKMKKSLAQNINSSWTQAGYLEGKAHKSRVVPNVGLANVAYSLFEAYCDGFRGEALLETQWVRLLPLSRQELLDYSEGASRNGMMRLMRSGGVLEIRFPGYLAAEEEEEFRG